MKNFDTYMSRVRQIRGRVQLFETLPGLWTAGIWLNDGRKYEWGAGPDIAKALGRAVEVAEKETCWGLA